jgi:trimethylamine--corrinoid protein Co-methyltransferase
MKLAALEVLSDAEIKQIHEATIDILVNCGVKVLNRKMLDFLASRGLQVNIDAQIVKFTRSIIEDAIAKVPRRFDVFNREGEFAFTLGDGTPRVAAGHNAVFWVDTETGKTRPSTVADVEVFARICDHLKHIDMVGIPVMPQDVPNPKATLLYGVRACVENSKKPIYFSTDKPDVNRACINLLRAAFRGDFDSQVYGISQLSPTSPLFWEESVCEAIEDTVRLGVPLAILPEPNAGVSAPFTLAGLLTINNAECLSGIAICQLIRPEAKVIYANSWTVTDMRTGAALVGSVETSICRIAGAQLAKFYNIPCHTTAPNSDNHAHDEQNSWEKTLSQFVSIAAGNDLVVNCGMFATGMTCSHEQLLMDEEITAISRRLAAGIEVNEDTIVADLIKQIGPQGETYLTAEHTLKYLHSDEYHVPRLAVRGPRASWEAAGAKDTYEMAKDLTREFLRKAHNPIDAERKSQLDRIVAEFSAQ